MGQVFSVSEELPSQACETIAGPPHHRLRRHVAGYAGFRTRLDPSVRRRIFPLNMTIVLIDVAGGYALVAGPRHVPARHEGPGWQHGVTIGLTPWGTRSLLGTPVSELVGRTVPLEDLLGRRAGELTDRLAASPDWAARRGLLDERLSAWLTPQRDPDGAVTRAWWQIHASDGRVRIGRLAEDIGVSRRYLEIGFRRQISVPPKTVARVARFQHAVDVLSRPSATFGAAVACGYADQPHFNREFRAMAGITPTQLCAFLQYVRPLTD